MTDKLTDDEKTQYEAEWEQVSEKVLLAQIYAELQQIRVALTDAQTGSDGDDEPEMYECKRCNATLTGDDAARHAESEHKAPPGEWQSMFERVQ